jgi:elongation factor P
MKASEMQKGQTVRIDGKLYAIVDYQHVKLGKGGAVYQTKLKGLADGLIQNIRLRAEENVEEAELDKRTYEYLYSSGSKHFLMDTTNYDQITLDDDAFGDGAKYLKPNTQLHVRGQTRDSHAAEYRRSGGYGHTAGDQRRHSHEPEQARDP